MRLRVPSGMLGCERSASETVVGCTPVTAAMSLIVGWRPGARGGLRSRTPGRGAAVLPFAGDIRLRGKFGDAAFADLELRCELGNRAGADRAVIRSDTCEGIWIVVFGQRQTRAGNIVGNTQAGGAQQLVDRRR